MLASSMRRLVLPAALLLAACTRPSAPPVTAPSAAPPPDARAPAAVSDAAVRADVAPDAYVPRIPCRSALTFPPPRVAAPTSYAARRATAPAVVRACEVAARATRQRLATVLADYRDDDDRSRVSEPLVTCADAGEGAWTFSVTVGRRRPGELENEFVYPVTLRAVYVTAAGVARPSARTVSLVLGAAHFAHFATVADVGVFEWDGDGRAELFFREAHEQEENNNDAARATRWWIFTAAGATPPREYAREAAGASWIDDYDGDARPDLLLRSPWVAVGPCGLSTVDNDGPKPLLHATADGRFVEDDVSHAWLASQCPARPHDLFDGLGVDDAPASSQPQFRVACARLYGVSADEVAARVERTYPPAPSADVESPAYCYPREELVRVARVDPPGAFRLGCAGVMTTQELLDLGW
jgi:hypothetical protein